MATLALLLALCAVSGSHQYVLLSASLDDVHSLAKQIAASPVAGALIRRASTVFNQELHAMNGDKYRYFRKSQPSAETEEHNEIHIRRHLAPEHTKGEHPNRIEPVPDMIEELKTIQTIDDPRVTFEENQDKAGHEQADTSNEATEKDDDHHDEAHGNRNDHDAALKLSKTQELVALGKNASLYLDDIKKIIQQV